MWHSVFIGHVSEVPKEIGSEFLGQESQYSRVPFEKIRINTSWRF
jgi:hypothetical protein